MSLIVQKFGGSSLAEPEQIIGVAHKISELYKAKNKLIVVTSAMGKTTDQLTALAYKVSPHPLRREFDMLLSTGERVSMALMAMALNDLGCPSISFTGSQAGIMTDGDFSNATIKEIRPIRIEEALKENKIVVLAGFQGVDPLTKEVTTLGRGGSDTTAVAMAAHFKADRCEILKDVNGVFTVDPQVIANAKKLDTLTGDELYDFCFWGAKVLNYKSVDWARKHKVPLYIGRSDNFLIGTKVEHDKASSAIPHPPTPSPLALGVNSHRNVIQISVACTEASEGLHAFDEIVRSKDLALPQILMHHYDSGTLLLTLAIDANAKANYLEMFSQSSKAKLFKNNLSTVTTTFTGGKSQTQIVAAEDREMCIKRLVDGYPWLVG